MKCRWVLAMVLLSFLVAPLAWTCSINVGTIGNEGAWRVVTELNIIPTVPFQATIPGGSGLTGIGLTSTLQATGTPLAGVDPNTWDGYWVAYYDFWVPLNATNLHLHINNAVVDDKAAIWVNRWDYTDVGYFGVANGTGAGTFDYSGGFVLPVQYSLGQNWTPAFEDLHPGWNTIWATMNNTGATELDAPMLGFQFNQDYAYLSLDATVTYVPEPATFALVLTGLSLAGVRRFVQKL